MRAGDLDREIDIERYSLTRGPQNQPIEAWTSVGGSRPASWRRASARESLASAQVGATVTDIFEIRWDDDFAEGDPKDRLVYDGKTYDITSIEEIGRREGLRINATRHANGVAP